MAFDEFDGQGTPQGDSFDQAPEPEFDVTVDGQTLKVPQSELLKGYSRNADYTRKTQALAEREKQWQGKLSEYESAFTEIAGFLDSEDQIKAYIAKRFAQQQQAQGVPPGQQSYLTPQQMQAELAKVQKGFEQRLTALQMDMGVQQLASQMGTQVDAKLVELKTKYPQVFFRPGMERLIREEVGQLGAKNIGEALKGFEDVVSGYARDLAKSSGAPMGVRGIEPPGGVATMPREQGDFSDVRDPRLREQVMQDLIRGMGRNTE
jgi:hypothetical protein